MAFDLQGRLGGFGPPAFYLDFEAFLPAVPLYPALVRIRQFRSSGRFTMPNSSGGVSHREFLADANSDPRRPFAETLIAAVKGSKLPIIVYSSYEQTRLAELAAHFPDLAKPLRSITRRLADLLPIVRSAVYHPKLDFGGSRIKTAAPALVLT